MIFKDNQKGRDSCPLNETLLQQELTINQASDEGSQIDLLWLLLLLTEEISNNHIK